MDNPWKQFTKPDPEKEFNERMNQLALSNPDSPWLAFINWPDKDIVYKPMPKPTAQDKTAVVKPSAPQRVPAIEIPRQPSQPLDTKKSLFPNDAPVAEEFLRRYLKSKNLYHDFLNPKYRGLTPWDIIELQMRARDSGLNPTDEELSI